MAQSPATPAVAPTEGGAKPVAVKRWRFPRLPVLIGVIGLGAAVSTGTLVKRRTDARQQIEAQAIREEMKEIEAQVFAYRSRVANLRWNAAKLSEAVIVAEEPLKSWARERSRRFAALVAEIERERKDADASLRGAGAAIEALCARGEIAEARAQLVRLRPPKFPEPEEFLRLQAAYYLGPLAQFSRRNPDYYRALRTFEPEASAEDVAALRRELAAAGEEAVTPQTMLGFELLSAVAPPGDPLLADWATMVSAPDFFENPDAVTVAHWRRAQKALRLDDWPTAVAQMQAIVRSKVRTRQPFRAAYGRAILRNTPDDAVAAYPFMQEAAAAGDVAARAWISEEDFAKGKHAAALPWLEARANDGEADAVAPLLAIYAMKPEAVSRDAAREAATLQKITVGPDAPAEALALLARLYESGRIERSAEKAFVCYQRAAEKGHIAAAIEAAERHLRGTGTAVDLEAAREWAAKAFAAGERERSVPMLIELMRATPDRTAAVLQPMFEHEHENVAAPAGFADVRLAGQSVRALEMMIARHFDRQGRFAQAARFYARAAAGDAGTTQRLAELTTPQACAMCAGSGEVRTSVSCASCGGKGTILCRVCEGRGFSLRMVPPPCTTCGGSGGLVQQGRSVSCSVCEGTGKGKGSVTKEPCPNCASGRTACSRCESGRIKVTKKCVACDGRGARALADD